MRSLLNNQQWAGFGTNPKEELITHEKILLQTIKFDLQIEHPYSYILKFAKELKGSGTFLHGNGLVAHKSYCLTSTTSLRVS